ncbi:MAG: hypothetical protein WCZ10_14875 [Desulfobulbaceae bacterium]
MEHDITATEAVRKFSEILNQSVYRGDAFLIYRNGKPVAWLLPCCHPPAERSLGELETIFAQLPRLGDEAESFAHDIEEALAAEPAPPRETAWE